MAGKTPIQWTEHSWNPVVGCSILSPGCTNCYAMNMAARIEAMNLEAEQSGKPIAAPQYDGTTKKVNGHAVWTGKLAVSPQGVLLQPLKRKKPTMYFVNSMSDLFHESVPDEWIDKVFAVMALCPQHTFQCLTKRAKRMREYFDPTGCINCGDGQLDGRCCDEPCVLKDGDGAAFRDAMIEGAAQKIFSQVHPGMGEPSEWLAVHMPLPNVWLGTSTERQQEADERIPELLKTPAAVRFISAEPLLGDIQLHPLGCGTNAISSSTGPNLDWVITGGESGPDARPMHPNWARALRDECAAAGVPFFFKQWGTWAPDVGAPDAPHRDRIFEGFTDCAVWDGARWTYHDEGDQPAANAGVGERVYRIGKKAAGRLLDGQVHDARPGVVR